MRRGDNRRLAKEVELNLHRTAAEAARAEAVVGERQTEARRRAPYRRAWQAADAYREAMREVLAARALATQAGPECGDAVWDVLLLAARAETDALAALAEETSC